MNLPKQFRELGVLNSINPLPPDAQVVLYNLMQSFNFSRWPRELVVRTQALENTCGMTRKRLAVARNTLIQRGLIKYYPARQASGSPAYELIPLYDEDYSGPVFPTETHRGTQEGTHRGTQNGSQREHLYKQDETKRSDTIVSDEQPQSGGNAKVESSRTEPYKKSSAKKVDSAPRKLFKAPDENEVPLYFRELKWPEWVEDRINLQSSKFYYFYTANGWKVGRNPMKDWKAAIRNWIMNDYDKTGNNGTNGKTGQAAGTGKAAEKTSTVRSRGASIDDLESLKSGGSPPGEERTEFSDFEVVK